MKKLLLYLTFIFLTFSAFSKEKEAVRIGILYDEFVSTHGLPLVEKEIIDLIGNEYDISFPTDKKIFQRTNNKNEINKNLDTLLNDNSVDIVISAVDKDCTINLIYGFDVLTSRPSCNFRIMRNKIICFLIPKKCLNLTATHQTIVNFIFKNILFI